MQIRSVTTAVIEANFDWTIVRIETDDAVGWGESFFAPGLSTIIREMGQLIVGADARNIGQIGARLRASASGAGSASGSISNSSTSCRNRWKRRGRLGSTSSPSGSGRRRRLSRASRRWRTASRRPPTRAK